MSSNTITVLIHCELLPSSIEQGKQDLLALARSVLDKEPACLSIELAHDQDFPTKIVMIERWISREAYEGPHMQSEHMRRFIQQSGQHFSGPPEVAFCDVTPIQAT
jgi:quinol monooxygenase YgiN